MQKIQQGFTLIELMIVVAIIGILAAIAIPQYSEYQARSKVTAGLAEIAGAKTGFEMIVNDGGTPASPADVKLQAGPTANCAYTVDATGVNCALQNTPSQVAGKYIKVERVAATGAWSCKTDVDLTKYAPKGCN